jgi:hypothetical protein
MKVYRLAWTTRDGARHTGAPRFLTQEAAERVAKSLRRVPTVRRVAVECLTVQPIALPIPEPVPRPVHGRWQPAA